MRRHIYSSIVLTVISIFFFIGGSVPELCAIGIVFGILALIGWYIVFEEIDTQHKKKKAANCKEVFFKKTPAGICSMIVKDCNGILLESDIPESVYNKCIILCDE